MNPARSTQQTALIIGSGIGGLTAGIILAKLGWRVAVVEKNPLPGGLLRSYARAGVDCPMGVHYVGALGAGEPLRRLWDYLGVSGAIPLERMGVEGPIDRYVFDDFSFDVHEGLDVFAEHLKQAFPDDLVPIGKHMTAMREMWQRLSSLEMLRSSATTMLPPEGLSSPAEELRRLGCSPRLLSVLGVPAALLGLTLSECPGFYYHMTIASYLLSSWRLAGSSSQMAEAFVSRLRELGGELICGDGAAGMLVRDGRVTGAVLSSGRVCEAAVVIAALHPQNVAALLPPGVLRPAYAARLAQLANTKGIFSVILTVDAACLKALPHNVYRLYAEDGGDLRHGVFHQLRRSRQAGRTILSMMTMSGIDEWRSWEGTTPGRRGSDYEAAKEEKAWELIDEARELFGELADINLVDIFTPLTIRDRVGSPEGSAYGILRSTGQLLKTAFLSRPLVEGLFLAGQNSMAPGIMGTTLGAFQTVRRLIGDANFQESVMREFR